MLSIFGDIWHNAILFSLRQHQSVWKRISNFDNMLYFIHAMLFGVVYAILFVMMPILGEVVVTVKGEIIALLAVYPLFIATHYLLFAVSRTMLLIGRKLAQIDE